VRQCKKYESLHGGASASRGRFSSNLKQAAVPKIPGRRQRPRAHGCQVRYPAPSCNTLQMERAYG
jgi:hypothetical protein